MAEPESPSYAARSATKQYRTAPLKGVWQHAPYFHDGSAATLADVVQVYNTQARARADGRADERPDRVPEVVVVRRREPLAPMLRVDLLRDARGAPAPSRGFVEQRAEQTVACAQDLQVGLEQVLAELQCHQVVGQRVADHR